MKVLHFFKAAMPESTGGVEQFIDQLARKTQAKGIETHVLSLTTESAIVKEQLFSGYHLHFAKSDIEIASTRFSWSALKDFKQLAQQMDVIHYHYPWPFMDMAHFVARINKPTILTYHSDIIKQRYLFQLYRPLMRKFLNRVDRIVATSPNYVATSPILSRFLEKVEVTPIGLDHESYPEPCLEKLHFWREKFKSRPFFLFVGVFRYYKGLHILLEALKTRDYPFVFVGSGPLEADLKQQAATLNLNNVYFLGQLSEEDKVALLSLCYAFVFPSHLRSEAFGIALLEAAMFGKPMISCEIGTGTSFVNQSLQTGYVTMPNSPAALGEALDQLWNHPELAKRMGEAARCRFFQSFTAEKMAEDYVRYYQQLSEQHR